MKQFDYPKLIDQIWDDDISSYIAEINRFKEKQHTFSKTNPTELDKFLSTKSSNKIDGITTTNPRLWQLIRRKTVPRDKNEVEILNYYNILALIHESYEALLIDGNCITQIYHNLFKFEDLPNKQKLDILNAMCESYKNALKSEAIDSLILIHYFVLDFLCLRPFSKGNGRISRLLNLLLLYKCGYFVGCYPGIAAFIVNNVNAYYNAIQISGQGWEDEKNNSNPFIRYMLDVVLSCYKNFELRQNFADYINQTSYDAIKSFAKNYDGTFSKKDILTACSNIGGRSVAEVNLKKLINEGFIKRVGSYASALYIRANREIGN